ncbi:MAG: 5-formyltetrahydrofolate cyclo-ligase [Bacteroidota bacterium]
MDKKSFRKKYHKRREKIDAESLEEMSMAIANRSLALPIWDYSYYHIFLSISEKKEINTEYLLHILYGRDKSIVVPKANFSTHEMKHYLLQENTPISVSNYGIPEPDEGITLSPDKVEVVFVPLLAFDQEGQRIGYGKGFYDRFLGQCKKDAVFVGLSFFEAEKKLPSAASDIPLHYCVTPERSYIF